jgi:hypothetical protein
VLPAGFSLPLEALPVRGEVPGIVQVPKLRTALRRPPKALADCGLFERLNNRNGHFQSERGDLSNCYARSQVVSPA